VADAHLQQRLYRKYLLFVGSGAGLLLLFVWSFFEASVWFFAPDFLVMLYCFSGKAKIRRLLGVALAGSLLGGILYYLLCIQYPSEARALLLATPFINAQKLAFVSGLYDSYGVLGAFAQSVTLVPFKIWTNLMIEHRFSPAAYFLLVMLSRFLRFGVAALFAAWVGRIVGKRLERYFVGLLAAYVAIFLTIQIILE
jgi:membrane protein YqaA with SNARE-associated domain